MVSKARATGFSLLLAVAMPAFAQPVVSPQNPPAPPAAAPNTTASVPWSSLKPHQQQLLQKFGDKWSTLPAERQQALARGSERWLSMSTQQKDLASQRFQKFRTLPPEQKQTVRERWQKFRSLSPDQQSSVRDNFRKFRALPQQQRQMLRQRWNGATPAERQQMLQNMRERRMNRLQQGGRAQERQAPRAQLHAPPPREQRHRPRR